MQKVSFAESGYRYETVNPVLSDHYIWNCGDIKCRVKRYAENSHTRVFSIAFNLHYI